MTARAAHASAFQGGFADPVLNAQAVFRQVMNALARPGTRTAFEGLTKPPESLFASVGSIAATLFDHDTKIWLDPLLSQNEAVTGWLTFNTSAPLTPQMLDADFAVIADSAALPSLESFAQGTQEYPDRSTTLIIQIGALEGGPELRLTGPGIKDAASIAPAGLPDHFIEQWAGNRTRFPRGVDVILAAPEGIVGLPRTVKIETGS
ncbi:phosphonate C-P lyase system protein PhnH [Nitratireductor sp. XY-223]|uniref:phosphonate C-P lyase system protein PhnH n=1 Tax=Nitratireductor sp. XY-223 TaxID=2561926 RepID=UPI0010AB1551|nr:phosphonate C-P lyase system protein PhnH [Nitratireductor sp. XY-223]